MVECPRDSEFSVEAEIVIVHKLLVGVVTEISDVQPNAIASLHEPRARVFGKGAGLNASSVETLSTVATTWL